MQGDGVLQAGVSDRDTRREEVYEPAASFACGANVNHSSVYECADGDFEGFWEAWASKLHWYRDWDRVLEWRPPWAKWFIGGELNASYNCIDRHVKAGIGSKVAYWWEGEDGTRRTVTYAELLDDVCRFSNALRSLGVERGDVVGVYLPMVPELPIAMLACARIGAVHNVVFGGFSVNSVSERLQESEAKVLITVDGSFRRGKVIPAKSDLDSILDDCESIKHVVVLERSGCEIEMKPERDLWWHEVIASEEPDNEPEALNSEDPLFILYTSGSTGKPKGIVHTTGGYLTGVLATQKLVFDQKDEDVFWCSADCGWITGHSYVVYGPLLNGATSVMYEGAPNYPDKDRWWEIVERYKVSIFYTAPTAIRTCIKWGDRYPQAHDLSSLRLLGSVGEPINPAAWRWYHQVIGKERLPIVDTWWQTETGAIMITPLPGITPTKPGSATKPFPGIKAAVYDDQGKRIVGTNGDLVIERPWPAMFRTLFKDPERYVDAYWTKYGPNIYLTGDIAVEDEDGYIWIHGRADDVINVSGHRLSTAEIESAIVSHPQVAEAAAVGVHDELSGQAVVAFVSATGGGEPPDGFDDELRAHVADEIGKMARPKEFIWTAELPKTRSGKIMRRLLRDIAEGRALGDVTTLLDPAVTEKLREKMAAHEEV